MECPMCGGAELVHDTRDLPYSYKGESTIIRQISGNYCPACGECVLDLEDGDRYPALIAQFHQEVRERLGLTGPEPMLCPTCGGAELVFDTRDIRYTYKGETTAIPAVTGQHCNACGESISGMAEGNRIMQAMHDFKKQVDACQRSTDER